jgi:hypothetical protein
MSEPSNSDTPLKATFKVKLNGETVSIVTVGQAYRFITQLGWRKVVLRVCIVDGKRPIRKFLEEALEGHLRVPAGG